MKCLFKRILWFVALLCFGQILLGCVSLRIEKVRSGADVAPPPREFIIGKTMLADVLAFYGAPAEVVDMKGHFAMLYQKAYYRGGQLSAGIPLSDVLKSTPKLDAMGNLQRYDTAVFIFKSEGVLSEMSYVQGTNHPLWSTYWK
ncbi:MAG: hypothetical protein PHN75_13615 [Syntrophales bacterium]|nr:hypothetical protein [Syntrophales bacterium]